MTDEGQLYAPIRYKQIANEKYLISRYCNTSYTDVGQLCPMERQYLIEFLTEDLKKQRESIEKVKKK